MENKTNELKVRIREREEVLLYFAKYQIPFSESAYKTLSNELREWKCQLAGLEDLLLNMNYKMITSN